ncbi:MAG TPA: YlxR family protein, partial [Deinococcales bacterium]|nr:YlxR family protein [Deinococcales bacterium]
MARPALSAVPAGYRGPVRSCVSCRTRRPQGELLRLARTERGIEIDPERRLPGRGAYVCPDREACRSERQLRRFARAGAAELAERLNAVAGGNGQQS